MISFTNLMWSDYMRKRPSLLNDYINFVDTVTSPATKEMVDFKDSLEIIEENGIQPSRLLTASVGLSGEVGEFNDIVKKIVFQGKEVDDDTIIPRESKNFHESVP